ncbi:hypothetical protein IWZ01DRAFT_562195 [Phyllosticta capitalensis]
MDRADPAWLCTLAASGTRSTMGNAKIHLDAKIALLDLLLVNTCILFPSRFPKPLCRPFPNQPLMIPRLEMVKLCCSPLGKASLDQFPESARISPPNEPFFRLAPLPSPRAAHQNHSLISRLVAEASIAAVQGEKLEIRGSRSAWELSSEEGVRVGAEDGGSGLSTVSVASPESREEKLA